MFKKLVTEPNCKTRSTKQTDLFRAARFEARFVASVVEPTPPLLEDTAIIFPSWPPGVAKEWTSIFLLIWSKEFKTSGQLKGCVKYSSAPDLIARRRVSGL